MILIDNINYLREKFPLVREKLKLVEEDQNKQFQIEETRKGDKTLSYNKDEKKVYFHSKYDPIREAQAIIGEFKDIKDTNIIFYGTGLGYHIDLFIKENPNNNFYIFEPIEELMEKFLSIRNISRSEYKDLMGISIGKDSIEVDISSFLELNRKETIIIELPIHRQTFEEEFKIFSEIFLNMIKSKRSSIATDYSFQRRWIINSMKNFQYVLSTPNILMEKKGVFKNKPALLVAAGPSLNEEIENIKYIKENRLAYIFSVGSAINTLIYNDIYPDVATTYDPTELNQKVFEKVKEKYIKDIPMIFGSSVGYETLENYPGKKYHMITSQDKIANYYLEFNSDIEMDIVLDAPSIAVVTLQLLEKLGFSPIILVGQNLGYIGTAQHSEGIDYSKDLTEEEMKKALLVEDVYGNKIKTNDGFNRMREQMELYITNMKKGRVINTTRGGAKIQGTEFRELKNIIDNDLQEKNVIENWLDGNKTNYSKEELKSKVESMDIALDEAYRWIKEYNISLYKILDLVKNRNFKQLDVMYNKLDISITALESNSFFTTFILQMNRVQHKLLADAVKISKLQKDLYKKHMNLLNSYKGFIDICSKDIELIKPVYEEMKRNILEYVTGYTKSRFQIQDVKNLLVNQYENRLFNRMDIIVRYLAIEEYYKKNDYGFNIYEKMQKSRGQKVHDINRFKKLIESIEGNGFSKSSSILVDQNFKLLDGSHRLACALYFNIKEIPINIKPQSVKIEYSINWFKCAGFTETELELIKNKYIDIVTKHGLNLNII